MQGAPKTYIMSYVQKLYLNIPNGDKGSRETAESMKDSESFCFQFDGPKTGTEGVPNLEALSDKHCDYQLKVRLASAFKMPIILDKKKDDTFDFVICRSFLPPLSTPSPGQTGRTSSTKTKHKES